MSENCPKIVRRGSKHNFRTIFPIWSMLLFGDPVQCSPITMTVLCQKVLAVHHRRLHQLTMICTPCLHEIVLFLSGNPQTPFPAPSPCKLPCLYWLRLQKRLKRVGTPPAPYRSLPGPSHANPSPSQPHTRIPPPSQPHTLLNTLLPAASPQERQRERKKNPPKSLWVNLRPPGVRKVSRTILNESPESQKRLLRLRRLFRDCFRHFLHPGAGRLQETLSETLWDSQSNPEGTSALHPTHPCITTQVEFF